MFDVQLGARGEADLLAELGQRARLPRQHFEAEPLRIDEGEKHPAVGNVDRERAEALHFECGIQRVDEARHVLQLDTDALARAAVRARGDHAPRQVEAHDRLRFPQGEHAGLEQDRDAVQWCSSRTSTPYWWAP